MLLFAARCQTSRNSKMQCKCRGREEADVFHFWLLRTIAAFSTANCCSSHQRIFWSRRKFAVAREKAGEKVRLVLGAEARRKKRLVNEPSTTATRDLHIARAGPADLQPQEPKTSQKADQPEEIRSEASISFPQKKQKRRTETIASLASFICSFRTFHFYTI